MVKKKTPGQSPKGQTRPDKNRFLKGTSKAGARWPRPLTSDDTFKSCPDEAFRFSDTSALGKSHDIIAQDRAVRAINMGLGIRKPGYNIYVAGIQGTGKTSVIR